MSTSVILGLLTMIGFGFLNGIQTKPTKKLGPTRTVLVRATFTVAFLLGILLFVLEETTFDIRMIFIALGISLLGYFALISFLKGLHVGEVGIIAPIGGTALVMTIIFSAVVFSESLSLWKYFSMAIILIGVILISVDFKTLSRLGSGGAVKGIKYAIIAAFVWGVVFALFKYPVDVLGPVLAALVIEIGNVIYSGTQIFMSKDRSLKLDKASVGWLFIGAFFGAVGFLAYNFGIRDNNVSLLAAFNSSAPLISVLYGYLVYKEKLKLQQYFAVAIIITGLILLNYL